MIFMTLKHILPGLLRIGLGFTFLWAFFDKVFGLGFTTAKGSAWLDGVSPTSGFLLHGTHGPLASVFASLAGHAWVDWLFMLGLLGIGVALMFGVALRLAGASAAVLLSLMLVAASLPPEHNPIIDEHALYGLLSLWILAEPTRFTALSLANVWQRQVFVKRWGRWLM